MTDHADAIRTLASDRAHLPGALLPILHAIQDRFGHLPEATVATVADVLNLSRAEVHGVITFYHLFRQTPPGEKTLYICRSEACQAVGANALIEHARRHLGVDWHETTADGRISLEPIYCLGNCACGPSVMLDETVHGRVDAARLEKIVE